MWTVHKRMAELWLKKTSGHDLTREEMSELKICMDANMRMVFKLARLENLSLCASITNDMDWQHEICSQIDRMEESMK